MIKNNTPYLGKIKLTFEKDPYYTGQSKLNKVHLNLGFTKLVSRIFPNQLKSEGWEVDRNKIRLIELFTGGVVGLYKFEGGELPNSFMTRDGEYLGDIEQGWEYYQEDLMVCQRGVALAMDGYYGYTHRGGQIFKVGDRLFDGDYTPKEEDYEEWEWAGFQEKYEKVILKAKDSLELEWLKEDGITSIIPFNKRGKKEIENLEEAKQAAINMSKYLS